MVVPGRFGNHFGCPPQLGLWVSSFVVPSGVGLQAGNTVGALVGFSAFLQPNQNAYTKIEQGKVAKCRLRISTCLVQIGWGVFIPLTFVS
jgi:hypothetical protein